MQNRTLFLFIATLCLSLICTSLTGQSCAGLHDHSAKNDALLFVPNKNQWHSNVAYRVGLAGISSLYLEKNALTWHFHDMAVLEKYHNDKSIIDTIAWANHAYQVKFLGALSDPQISGRGKQQTYHNYFKGKDASRWAGKVPVFHGVVYEELYAGIDMAAYSQDGNFKYDFILSPGTDPSIIQLGYEGTGGLCLDQGNLIVETSVTQIEEQKPYAYQMIDGKEVAVDCNYVLENNIVSFDFPNGYDNAYPLTIDPVVVAATISGGQSDNWGFTATYDNAGNIYAGGNSFGVDYPTTLGAFQTVWAGGNTDIAVTKYNPDGSQQIYATYIGGSGSDQPHSMIVDFNGQLCIYGITRSSNYPVTGNAVQTNNGGSSDIVVTKLNASGSALIGSTYLGGNQDDGINQSAPNSNDANRGEIILDAQNNIYITSSTISANFPVTPNAFQTTIGGSQDVVALKLNSDLSALFWSTYLGGSSTDVGLGIRVLDDGKVIASGMAGNESFPVGEGGFQSTWPGGTASAFIVKLSSDGQNIENSTFFGSTGNDYSYFVDLDEEDNVHIYGQTTGVIDITPDTYFSTPGSRQFLAGFSPNLDERIYSTVIGTPTGFGYNFIPVAFMVDKCNGIYFSGYGADSGLPTTADAIEQFGDDYFYLAKLSPNAEALEFATYYGNSNHVDGGTSRFDKSGVVYQAVCSCVPNGNVMNTLPNAYSSTNSSNCSIGVFKVDFEIETVTASAFIDAPTSGCVPLTVDFNYTGSNGEFFFWDFGTGDTSMEQNPSYTFTETGSYTVMQIAIAPTSCNLRDTFLLQIDVLDNNSTLLDTVICSEESSIFLDATTINATYEWQDGSINPTFNADDSGVYWVDVSLSACARRDSFVINFYDDISTLDLGIDQSICDETAMILNATLPDAATYEWNDGSIDANLVVTTSGNYAVTVTNFDGCETTDDINITFGSSSFMDTVVCVESISLLLTATTDNATYQWQDGTNASTFNATTSGTYWVDIMLNTCSVRDSFVVEFYDGAVLDLGIDQGVCDEASTILDATVAGAIGYEWNDGTNDASLVVTTSGNYAVTVTSSQGCEIEDDINITFSSSSFLDTVVCAEEFNLLLDATTSNASYQWQDGNNSSTYNAINDGTYWVDINLGTCSVRDSFVVDFYDISILDLGIDQAVCDVNSITIDATLPNVAGYEWNDGSTQSSLLVTTDGNYAVTVTSIEGCESIDDINLNFEITPDLDLGMDMLLCQGETFTIIPTTTSTADWSWQDGSTAPTFTVTNEGLYQVTANFSNGCVGTDEVFIAYSPTPFVDFNHTDVICFGENNASINIINPTSTTDDYLFDWSNGTTQPDLANLAPGTYRVTVTSTDNCMFETEIIITQPDSLIVVPVQDDVDCFGDGNGSIIISDITGGVPPYLNSLNGDTLSSATFYNNLDGGLYTVLTQDANNCTAITEIDIYEPAEVFLSAGEDKPLLLGDSVQIDGFLTPILNQVVTWTSVEYLDCTDCIQPYGKPNYTAEYIVTAVDSITGCTHMDTMIITVEKPRNVYIPNAFSPNGDGTNDSFFPNGDISAELVTNFRIFDRWGELVYEAFNGNLNDPKYGWDGLFNGEPMNPGVFVYVLEIQFIDGFVKQYQGDVSIIK